MAFTGPATSRLLLLTDAGHDAVHVIDVAGRVHAGYVAAPGTIAGPRGVAARGSLVAVSAWKKFGSGDHVVRVFEGSGVMWTGVRVLAGGFGGPGWAYGQLYRPRGLRFTGDGTELAVADRGNDRVSVFRVEDGSFARHVATGLGGPMDVEECKDGWLVACLGSHTIEFVDGGGVGRARMGSKDCGDGEFQYPSALALVPGLGLVVRDIADDGRLQVFATPDAIAMASMSVPRVAWIVAVARGRLLRQQCSQRARDTPTCKRPSRRGPAGPGANLKQ
jgi:DNA-binding beta-propeller fold protein YncE